MIPPIIHKNQKLLFLLLAILCGIIFIFPYHNFQLHIAQGDHGRDFYCFKKTLDGQIPYKDYWWVYGPLMPYYYAFFYSVFGINMHSVLLGYNFLYLLSGIFIYLSIHTFASPLLALTGAIWFWVFTSPFEHTFNHTGGILMTIVALYAVIQYIKYQNYKHLYMALGSIFLLTLVKINFGYSSLIAFIISFTIINKVQGTPPASKKSNIYLLSLIGIPLLISIIYWLFVKGLPLYVIRQCFPYLNIDHPFHATVEESTTIFFKTSLDVLKTHWGHSAIIVLTILALIRIVYLTYKNKMDSGNQKQFFLILTTLIIFSIGNLHEFLISGVVYRSYWIKPMEILMMFLILSFGTRNLSKAWIIPLCLLLIIPSWQRHSLRTNFIKQFKQPAYFIPMVEGQIYTANSRRWIETVTQATDYLRVNLNHDETFLALVDDPLYYFLTGKDSPTRQLTISDHINIQPEQEKEIISALEQKKINFILISNRQDSPEPGMGTFGKTYGQHLHQYIHQNFEPIMTFGDWNQPPRWFDRHAVKIWKRSES